MFAASSQSDDVALQSHHLAQLSLGSITQFPGVGFELSIFGTACVSL
jgi:hypothetical protein